MSAIPPSPAYLELLWLAHVRRRRRVLLWRVAGVIGLLALFAAAVVLGMLTG